MVAPPALFRRPPQYGLDRTRLDLVLLVFLAALPSDTKPTAGFVVTWESSGNSLIYS